MFSAKHCFSQSVCYCPSLFPFARSFPCSFLSLNRCFLTSCMTVFSLFLTTVAPLKQPELEAEVLFVIDSSYEVDQGDYKRQKEFIKSLLRGLDMSTESSRAALITYGDHSSIASRFIGLQSLDDFDKSVDNASYIGGDRRIDNALKMVARLLNEAEAASSKLVIFLTGGKQSSSGGSLNDAVEPLRQSGAKTFVIAIGKQPDVQQLRPLVASPNDVLTVITFKDLNSQTSRIASHVREKAGKGRNNVFFSGFDRESDL